MENDVNQAFDIQSIDDQISALQGDNEILSTNISNYEHHPVYRYFDSGNYGRIQEEYNQNSNKLDELIKKKTAMLDSERQREEMLRQFDVQREAFKKMGISDKYLLQYNSMFNRDFVKTGEPNYNALEFSSNKSKSKSIIATLLGAVIGALAKIAVAG